MKPRRGDVYWVRENHPIGQEVQKTRPAVIVSRDSANMHLERVVLIPLSSQTERIHAGEVAVDIDNKPAKALIHQITTVSNLRLGKKIGALSETDLDKISHGITIHLDLL